MWAWCVMGGDGLPIIVLIGVVVCESWADVQLERALQLEPLVEKQSDEEFVDAVDNFLRQRKWIPRSGPRGPRRRGR